MAYPTLGHRGRLLDSRESTEGFNEGREGEEMKLNTEASKTIQVKCPSCGMMVKGDVLIRRIRIRSHYYKFLSSLGACPASEETVSIPKKEKPCT